MKELSKSELGLIMGGSTEDWCKAVKTIVSNIENHGNLPTTVLFMILTKSTIRFANSY